MKGQRIAIVAMGPSKSEYLKHAVKRGGPYTEWDRIWAVNTIGGSIVHDLMFHMDDVLLQELRAPTNPPIAEMLRWMKFHPVPIFTSTTGKDRKDLAVELRGRLTEETSKSNRRAIVGTSRLLEKEARRYNKYKKLISFPLQEVLESTGASYLNTTPAYAIAWGIHNKVASMDLFGLDFTIPDQNLAEMGRACCEQLVGIAKERGIMVRAPESSRLLDNCEKIKFYGYDAWDVRMTRKLDGEVILSKTPQDLPSAEEIEERYKKVPAPKFGPLPEALRIHLEKQGME